MPGIVMFAPTRTVPTSTRAPDDERNSIVKVFRPVRSVPVGDRTTMSMSPDRTVWTTRPASRGRPGVGRRRARESPARKERAHDRDQEHRRDQDPASAEGTWRRNGERLVLQPQLPLADREEDDRRHDQHVDERRDHAAEHRRGQRFHHFRADTGAPHDRQQPRDDGGDRHHLGSQAEQRAFHDRVAQRRTRERASELAPLALDGLFQIDDHHDAGLHRRPEERDEADPDRDREVVAQQPQQVDASGQCKRHGEQHMGGFDRRPVREVAAG